MKMGFYPAPNEAIAELAKHLTLEAPPDKSAHYILDPCAGKGEAIATLADCLGIPYQQVHAIELDVERGEAVRARMPDAKVLSPCSFFSHFSPWHSYSLVYCNPPFADELGGGGREETAFIRDCHHILAEDGILVFVAPWQTIRNDSVMKHMDCHYKEAKLLRFPEMKYRECVYIGVKRHIPLTHDKAIHQYLHSNMQVGFYSSRYEMPDALCPLGTRDAVWYQGEKVKEEEQLKQWQLPAVWKPHKFEKVGYVDGELEEDVEASPLNELFDEQPELPPLPPPLPLIEGHVGLQLAAGALNCLLELPNGLTHLVKGVPSKIEYLNEEACEEKLSKDGKHVNVKTVYSQQPSVKVRALGLDGVIYTFEMNAGRGAKKKEKPRVEEKRMPVEDYAAQLKAVLRTPGSSLTFTIGKAV